MNIIVVSESVPRAADLAKELAFAQTDIVATSPLGIKTGAGRGVVANLVLIDDSAWPLDEESEQVLRASLIGGPGQMYRLERV